MGYSRIPKLLEEFGERGKLFWGHYQEAWKKLSEYIELPEELFPLGIAIAIVESSLDQSALGTSSDIGYMQVTPIAKLDVLEYYKLDFDLADPIQNIMCGLAYLYMLAQRYRVGVTQDGLDLFEIARAYNAGPSAKRDPEKALPYANKVFEVMEKLLEDTSWIKKEE